MANRTQNSIRNTRQNSLRRRQYAWIPPVSCHQEDVITSVPIKRSRREDEEVATTTYSHSLSKRPRTDASSPKKGIRGSSAKKRKLPHATESPHPVPDDWREVYEIIKAMRSRITAPADTLGCEQSKYKESDPKNSRLTTLVYLMLSSQTKDEITDTAVTKLRNAVGGTLSVDAVIATDESVISESINKVGFWRRKSGYIKRSAQKLRDEFGSDVPKTLDELCSLPGIGIKMAILILHVAWDINHGIGVDSHVHRITNRLGWHRKPTKDAEGTRLSLESWLPSELHREINLVLVGFGQVICTPTTPQCDKCELPAQALCPSAHASDKRRNKKVVTTASQHPANSSPKVNIELEEEG